MPDPVLEALWKRITDNWDDDRAHEAFLRHCHDSSQLGEAAARYRPFRDDEVRGPLAQKRLGAIALLAMNALLAERKEPRRKLPKWMTGLVALACASVVAWLIVQIFGG